MIAAVATQRPASTNAHFVQPGMQFDRRREETKIRPTAARRWSIHLCRTTLVNVHDRLPPQLIGADQSPAGIAGFRCRARTGFSRPSSRYGSGSEMRVCASTVCPASRSIPPASSRFQFCQSQRFRPGMAMTDNFTGFQTDKMSLIIKSKYIINPLYGYRYLNI